MIMKVIIKFKKRKKLFSTGKRNEKPRIYSLKKKSQKDGNLVELLEAGKRTQSTNTGNIYLLIKTLFYRKILKMVFMIGS